ncbi:Crp/Fnr family transcriptional regulator [Luteolibacter algae]|uniref:Crp/Fnr family transcriptional regulator n=1 Tax=Luteolibacter algae TaxID=454151 RepID=A0ABW5D641_9BACT
MNRPEIIKRAALASALKRVPIFQGLPAEDVERIAGYASRQSLEKGEILFEEGGEVKGFYIVTKGLIKAYRIGEGGREQLIHLVHPDESFAEPAVAGLPGYPAHTRALGKTEVILIPAAEFLAHLREQSDLALRMLASLSRHLHDLVSTIENYKLRDAETRLLHWLVRRCGGEERTVIKLGISKGVLASELGTRQETLSRIFAKLRAAGEIRVEGREIVIPDTGRLRRLFEQQLHS